MRNQPLTHTKWLCRVERDLLKSCPLAPPRAALFFCTCLHNWMSACGYKETFSRSKLRSALPPAADIPAQRYGSGPIWSGLWPCSVHPH